MHKNLIATGYRQFVYKPCIAIKKKSATSLHKSQVCWSESNHRQQRQQEGHPLILTRYATFLQLTSEPVTSDSSSASHSRCLSRVFITVCNVKQRSEEETWCCYINLILLRMRLLSSLSLHFQLFQKSSVTLDSKFSIVNIS